jgi:Myb-like DNA-binding domain
MLAYMFSTLNPCITQMYFNAWPQFKAEEPASSVAEKAFKSSKKYHRTWKKNQVEEVFNSTTKYCQSLSKSMDELNFKDFEIIAKNFEQTPEQIMNKVNEIYQNGTLRPGIWSQPEDDLLKTVLKKGLEKWGQIANLLNKEIHKGLKIRTGKQCKERWNNYLNPQVNRGAWTEQEDIIALESYKTHGNKWSIISKSIPDRTESAVKNRIKSLINKIKQDLNTMDDLSVGIDKIIMKKQNFIMESSKVDKKNSESEVPGQSFDLFQRVSQL